MQFTPTAGRTASAGRLPFLMADCGLLFAVGTMPALMFFSAADLLSCFMYFLERIYCVHYLFIRRYSEVTTKLLLTVFFFELIRTLIESSILSASKL
jgi:hypothetical protein